MDRLTRECAERLTAAVKESPVYTRYLKSAEELKTIPGAFERVMDLRRQTIGAYHGREGGDLAESSDLLAGRYAELEDVPEVYEFLDAEEELVRMLQELYRMLIRSINLYMPDLS